MGWPTQSLEAVAALVRGVSFDKSEVTAEPGDGRLPILRAGNISDVLDTRSDLIWVPSTRVRPDQRLRPGDIAICMSSGSQAVVGKSAPLREDWSGSVGAFCAIVRPEQARIDPEFLALYMRSEAFRAWTRRSEGANIKNIRHSELLDVRIPVPPMDQQRRAVDLLSRAENIVRMRREAEQKAKEIIPALFLDMFGDPATNPKGWGVAELRDHIELLTGYPFKSVEFVPEGETVRLCRGANVLPQQVDWSDARYWPMRRSDEFADFALRRGDIVLAMDRPWISTGLKVARISESDLPALLVQRVARIRPKPTVVTSYIYAALCHPSFAAHCNAVKTETVVPHISPNDIRSYRLPIPPVTAQALFASVVESAEGLSRQSAQALEMASGAFQSLLAGVFSEGQVTSQESGILCRF